MKVKVETKSGIFDCTGELLYEGLNSKKIYLKYPIGTNNKYVYVVKSDADGQIRGFYKKEILKVVKI